MIISNLTLFYLTFTRKRLQYLQFNSIGIYNFRFGNDMLWGTLNFPRKKNAIS